MPKSQQSQFTDVFIQRLKGGRIPENCSFSVTDEVTADRYTVWEGKGFGVRVGKTGKRSFVGVYRFGGKVRKITYGSYPEMSLSEARQAHATAVNDRKSNKIDPGAMVVAARKAEREAETIDDLCDEYLRRIKKRSIDQDRRNFDVTIRPAWGKRKAKDITTRDIAILLDRIEDRGSPVMRNRIASLLSRLFKFAISKGYIAPPGPYLNIERLKEESRERTLTPDEIRSLWTALDTPDLNMDRATVLAIKFCLVTGQRRGEVAGTPWAEIDMENALWNLPKERTKNGKPNVIPLPALAMDVLREAETLRVRKMPLRPDRKDGRPYDPTPSAYLFPSPQNGKPIGAPALTTGWNRCRDLLGVGDATIHDLRRTFATTHGELGTPLEILQALVNHTPPDVTRRVYNKAINLEPRRIAMNAYCTWLTQILTGEGADNVVALHGRVL